MDSFSASEMAGHRVLTGEGNAMAPHSSTLAWRIPWMEEPGRLQSMGSLRVGHDWATSLSLFTLMHWRRKWQPTLVFLPGESQGRVEPRGLLSMGSHRVGHNWRDLAAAVAFRSGQIKSLFAFLRECLREHPPKFLMTWLSYWVQWNLNSILSLDSQLFELKNILHC